jgi:hypothetical protein
MVPVPSTEPLTVENVLWSNTVLAAGSAVGFVIYTGSQTRAVMNTSHPETKVGLLDLEINNLAKVSLTAGRFLPYDVPTMFTDSLRCNICAFCCPCRFERVSWILVYLCHFYFPLLDPLLVYHSHKVMDDPSLIRDFYSN